jgi:hypothetical protein
MMSRRMKSIALLSRQARLLSDQQSLTTAQAADQHRHHEQLHADAGERALAAIADLHQQLRRGEVLQPDRYANRAHAARERLSAVQTAEVEVKKAEARLGDERAKGLRLRLQLEHLADRGDAERRRIADAAAIRSQKEGDDRWVMRNTREIR